MPTKLCHVTKPCASCPFRRDGDGFTPVRLYTERVHEVVSVVAPIDGRGGTFPCHKTVDHDDRDPDTERECAGALIFAYKLGASSQMTRIAERLGLIDPELAEGAHREIFDTLDEMLETALDYKPAAGRRKRRVACSKTRG